VRQLSTRIGSTGRFLCAVAPLVAATLGCSASIEGPGGGSGASGGASGTSGSGATAGKSAGGGGNTPGQGGSSNGGTGATSNGGTSGATVVPAAPQVVSMKGEPLYSRFLRLTNSQWENSVHDILKLTAATGLSDNFEHAVGGTTDFENNERVVYVNDTSWADFQTAAETVANQVTATDAALKAVGAGSDKAGFISAFGRRAFRRALTAAEVTTYGAVYDLGTMIATGSVSTFTKGARYVIGAMLQSPNFLYRIEMGDTSAPLSGYEMASKVSLWLRDTTPSDAMLDAAAAGTFDTAQGAAEQAQTMLTDPNVATVIRRFNGELYKFALYDSITKVGVPEWSADMNPEMKEASYLFFDRIFSQGLGVSDIFTSTAGFIGPKTASLYGMTAQGTQIKQVDTGRAGYYAQVPFLTRQARNNDPDSIHRGVRINTDALCADPGVPSPDLPDIPVATANETNRQIITGLTKTCGAECHGQVINPVGFAFEDFDGMGRKRTMDNGSPVDTTGTYPFAEGTLSFKNSAELMQLIATGSQAHQCWAKKMASYALERDLIDSERPMVESLGAVSQAGGSLKDVMVALVKENGFRTHVGAAQ
jgi:hypothetical protein